MGVGGSCQPRRFVFNNEIIYQVNCAIRYRLSCSSAGSAHSSTTPRLSGQQRRESPRRLQAKPGGCSAAFPGDLFVRCPPADSSYRDLSPPRSLLIPPPHDNHWPRNHHLHPPRHIQLCFSRRCSTRRSNASGTSSQPPKTTMTTSPISPTRRWKGPVTYECYYALCSCSTSSLGAEGVPPEKASEYMRPRDHVHFSAGTDVPEANHRSFFPAVAWPNFNRSSHHWIFSIVRWPPTQISGIGKAGRRLNARLVLTPGSPFQCLGFKLADCRAAAFLVFESPSPVKTYAAIPIPT
jgi:hypothetical protein